MPDSTLVVTHMYSNNSSKYTVNGATSNYKDVTALLTGKGIDLDHNRVLILQACALRWHASTEPKPRTHRARSSRSRR